MHELSIAMSIVDAASEEAERHPGRVTAVHVKLGPLSGVVKEALNSAFELAREGSALAEAEMLFEETAITIDCPTCRGPRAVKSLQQIACADCGTPGIQVLTGNELQLVALEIQ